jgi:RNA polymerase sigma-70 factor (ECF subfamily)
MVYGICLTHTRCRSDADDVFQEVFLTYHRKQPQCHDEEHRKAWLITTTMNLSRRVATSTWRTRVVPYPQDQESTRALEETFHFGVEEYDALFAALAGLPDTYRSVIHLFYFEDLPISQIGSVLALEPGAVKTRLSRGRTMLREALSKEDSHV